MNNLQLESNFSYLNPSFYHSFEDLIHHQNIKLMIVNFSIFIIDQLQNFQFILRLNLLNI
jgi:hypothetical protein